MIGRVVAMNQTFIEATLYFALTKSAFISFSSLSNLQLVENKIEDVRKCSSYGEGNLQSLSLRLREVIYYILVPWVLNLELSSFSF